MISTARKTLPALAPAALALASAFAGAPARAEWNLLNMPVGVTELSKQIYSLHMTIFWWCVAIGVAVFGVMIYSLVKFRKSTGAVPDTSITHSTRVEIVWTVVPVLILVVMAIPAARTLINIEDMRNTEMTVKVTGYQWRWQYEYLDEGVSFFSVLDRQHDEIRQLSSGLDPKSVPDYLLNVDNPLVVPVDTKVRLLLTAQDVIHAWWVPDFGMKKDAIPGFVNELWFKVDADKVGTYRGQCAELCGRDHAFMPVVVKVLSKEDYKAWLAQQKAAAQPPAEGAAPAADAPAQASAPAAPAVIPAAAATAPATKPVASAAATPVAARG
ncbi:MAG: cytochrome c oxidase subunit II [Steroidobacteraceae bacterium]|jgi:cytochrome c oxidase subunit 2|nr:cytochrome c oxidase subunit II [Steroidobacteraceae bacterium]